MLMRHPSSMTLLITVVLSSTLTMFTGLLGVTGVSAQAGTPPAAANALDDRIRSWIEAAIDPARTRCHPAP